jgi:hypothetical protein
MFSAYRDFEFRVMYFRFTLIDRVKITHILPLGGARFYGSFMYVIRTYNKDMETRERSLAFLFSKQNITINQHVLHHSLWKQATDR